MFAKTLEDVRTDLERTEDLRQTPMDLTEFIEKQGDGSWLERLQEVAGPWLMVQLADAANMFEILRKFVSTLQFTATFKIRLLTLLQLLRMESS
jgi:hypothetical protein